MHRFAFLLFTFLGVCLVPAAISAEDVDLSQQPAARNAASASQVLPTPSGEPVRELRGVWITNVDSSVLQSRESIAEAMDFLALTGFNVVYPVMYNKAMTLYPSKVMEREFGLPIDPKFAGRDPLRELIVEAHRAGLEVVPWFEFGFATSYNDPTGGHILQQRPEWRALDAEGNLATKNNFQWANALDPEVRAFLSSIVLEVVQNYDVDGIQGDDRMPALPTTAGYDEATKALYRKQTGQEPPADPKDPAWVQWRADILTEWLADLREQVKAIDPNLTISMAPSYWDWALYEYLQDSKTWTDRGLLDSFHPQGYRYDLEAYKKIVDDLVENQVPTDQLDLLAPGILLNLSSYLIPEDYLLGALAYNREKGLGGEVLFFYEGLRRNDGKMARLLRNTFYAQPAVLPYRESAQDDLWRPRAVISESMKDSRTGWGRAPQGLDYLMAPAGGERPALHYELVAPQAGTYDVFLKLPATPLAQAGTLAASLAEGSEPILINASQTSGWTRVGTARLGTEKALSFTVRHAEVGDGPVAVGPAMLLLNRSTMREER